MNTDTLWHVGALISREDGRFLYADTTTTHAQIHIWAGDQKHWHESWYSGQTVYIIDALLDQLRL